MGEEVGGAGEKREREERGPIRGILVVVYDGSVEMGGKRKRKGVRNLGGNGTRGEEYHLSHDQILSNIFFII